MSLSLVGLSVEIEGRPLFESITHTLEVGGILQVKGRNGSGKTTLLKTICGLNLDYEGIIKWHDASIELCFDDYSTQLIYIGHKAGVKETLTPVENLLWYGAMSGGQWPQEHIMACLEAVGLKMAAQRPVYTLSSGQKQRVKLARLLIEERKFWVLDEPFTALDQEGVAEFESLIDAHAKAGGMVLLTTHHRLGWQREFDILMLEDH